MNLNEKKLAKAKSVVSYLSSLGFIPVKSTGSYYYYYSPLPGRNEKNPSFLVRKADGRWNDRGINNDWDDVISLAMQMNGCDFKKAVNILMDNSEIVIEKNHEKNSTKEGPGVIIEDIKELHSNTLIRELKRRRVNVDIASLYCKEGLIRFPKGKNPERKSLFILFKNDLGGYECRNRFLKISNTPKYYTTIEGDTQDRDFFEGFIDFLSFLTFYKIERNKNFTYVLNSLIYLPVLHDDMKKPGFNNMYLDWGHFAEESLIDLRENRIPFEDKRDLYLMYDDINDMLRNYARLK
jgi:hypothetical protein